MFGYLVFSRFQAQLSVHTVENFNTAVCAVSFWSCHIRIEFFAYHKTL